MGKKELGKKIRAIRLSKGMKAKDLAEHAKISASYLSEVEQGASAISGERLLRIAKELDVSVSFLMESDEDSPDSDIKIPQELAAAAEQLNLPYKTILALLEGPHSLFARRSREPEQKWRRKIGSNTMKSQTILNGQYGVAVTRRHCGTDAEREDP